MKKQNLNNEVMVLSNVEFGTIRTVEEADKVLFCGSDVAKALGYDQPHKAIKQHCKEDGGILHTVIDSLGRRQQAKFIREGDVYRLITHSKLPSAEKFETWVFDEVLPTIRAKGGYIGEDATPDQVTNMVADWAKKSKYLTDDIHDAKSVRRYLRDNNLMELEDTVEDIIDVVVPAKGSVKHEIIDATIKELAKIDAERTMDTPKNVYIKTVAKDSIKQLQQVKIGKYKRKIYTLEQGA